MRRSATDIDAPGRDDASGYGLLNVPAALAYPPPVLDPMEPNDDMDYVRAGAVYAAGSQPLTTRALPSAAVTARLSANEDPRDVYPLFVPAKKTVTAKAAGATVDLALWSNGTPSVTIASPGKARLARGVTKGATETVTYRNPARRRSSTSPSRSPRARATRPTASPPPRADRVILRPDGGARDPARARDAARALLPGARAGARDRAGGDGAVLDLDAGWGLEAPSPDGADRQLFEPREPELDEGHALIGPIAVRGARAGQVLSVRIDELRVGPFGFTFAGGWRSDENVRLGVEDGPGHVLVWELDADAGTARDHKGRVVALRPFLGVLGMPPPEPGTHRTSPPRASGGNIDCSELVVGTTLLLPIPVDGALFSAGDGHARQGDGEVSGLAIECPMDLVQLTIGLRDDLELAMPVAETDDAWIAFGFDESLNEASMLAVDGLLGIMERELGLERLDALALASVVADLRVTQIVNGVRGVHAVLRRDAIRFP